MRITRLGQESKFGLVYNQVTTLSKRIIKSVQFRLDRIISSLQSPHCSVSNSSASRWFMAYLHLPAMSLNPQNLGCNRLQSCGHFARFCRDLPSYPVDLVDGPLGSVQFDTRHPPHLFASGSCALVLPGWIALQAKVDALKKSQAETPAELAAMLPSILDNAFKGEL